MKLYLSPSNQPDNKYAGGKTDEKAEMEAVAKKVKAVLDKDYGCETVMATLSLGIKANERPQEAKNKGCDYYIAIHSNAAYAYPKTSAASGAEAYYHPDSAKSKALATAAVQELNAVCPVKSTRAAQVHNGMKAFDGEGYGEIRSPMSKGIPPVLVEVNFHDNPEIADWIVKNKDAIAQALVRAITAALGIAKKAEMPGVTSTKATATPPGSGWQPRVRFLTANECYKAGKAMTPKGIMVHSTGANNPRLSRYVGPDDGYLGANLYNNHWNQPRPDGKQICCHAFIGKLENGLVATYQTLPWDMRGWHCGGAGNDTLIGFEICEDGLADRAYFDAVYQEAVQLCVYLCKLYKLGAADILDHAEGHKLGIASNHADVAHWFTKHGKSMDKLRAEVKARLTDSAPPASAARKADVA
jgi:N-acetylmuramoyl-L-alanine amidase